MPKGCCCKVGPVVCRFHKIRSWIHVNISYHHIPIFTSKTLTYWIRQLAVMHHEDKLVLTSLRHAQLPQELLKWISSLFAQLHLLLLQPDGRAGCHLEDQRGQTRWQSQEPRPTHQLPGASRSSQPQSSWGQSGLRQSVWRCPELLSRLQPLRSAGSSHRATSQGSHCLGHEMMLSRSSLVIHRWIEIALPKVAVGTQQAQTTSSPAQDLVQQGWTACEAAGRSSSLPSWPLLSMFRTMPSEAKGQPPGLRGLPAGWHWKKIEDYRKCHDEVFGHPPWLRSKSDRVLRLLLSRSAPGTWHSQLGHIGHPYSRCDRCCNSSDAASPERPRWATEDSLLGRSAAAEATSGKGKWRVQQLETKWPRKSVSSVVFNPCLPTCLVPRVHTSHDHSQKRGSAHVPRTTSVGIQWFNRHSAFGPEIRSINALASMCASMELAESRMLWPWSRHANRLITTLCGIGCPWSMCFVCSFRSMKQVGIYVMCGTLW